MKTKSTRKVQKSSSRNGSLPKPKKVGRPKIELPVEMAHGFGQLGLTFDDMADILGISRRTVAREFSEGEASDFVTEYRRGRANTNRSIRMKILQRAIKEDKDNVLLFAAKNYCGMKETAEVDHQGQISVNVTMGGEVVKQPKWMHN